LNRFGDGVAVATNRNGTDAMISVKVTVVFDP
jgi:hypothetical protein